MEPNKTVLEFFAGIGLMRIGLERSGWNVIWANDNDRDKKTIYEGHFVDKEDHFLLKDVHNIDSVDIPTATIATASFPCTDLSLAGARRGLSGKGSGAFWGFVDAIEGMKSRKPSIILLENVTGFLTSYGGDDFREACLALNELGYSVDAFIINAEWFVPQSRQRLFVVGSLQKPIKRQKEDEALSSLQGPYRPAKLVDSIIWNPEIKWAIRDLPKPPKRTITLKSILQDLSPNSQYWWSSERSSYLLNQMSDKHRKKADKMIASKHLSYGTVFRRVRNGKSMAELRTDGIAGCLRTPRGGSGRQILFVAGKGNYGVRLLTPTECARLMGVDDFRLSRDISLNKALFGFGDAVCVPVVEWLAVNYLNPLHKDLYVKSARNKRRTKTR